MVPTGVKEPSSGPHVVGVELIQDVSGIASPVEGFVRRYRHRAKTRMSDGTRTGPYVVDFVDRAPGRRNAAAVALYAPHEDPGQSLVMLRQQMRYPVYVSTGAPLLTEVVAGIIEGDESPEQTAVREVAEETGVTIGLKDVQALGGPFYSSPGIFTELTYVVAARLPADTFSKPLPIAPGDGSPLEAGARLVAISLDGALALPVGPPRADDGKTVLCDGKTEIALRRLREWLGRGQP